MSMKSYYLLVAVLGMLCIHRAVAEFGTNETEVNEIDEVFTDDNETTVDVKMDDFNGFVPKAPCVRQFRFFTVTSRLRRLPYTTCRRSFFLGYCANPNTCRSPQRCFGRYRLRFVSYNCRGVFQARYTLRDYYQCGCRSLIG